MTIQEVENEIIEEFSIFDDWMDKYQYLIDLSGDLEPLEDKERATNNIIDGCQSKVWITADYEDEKLIFKADSDAIITKGIVSLLVRVFSGRTLQEIIDADLSFIDEIGLRDNLSPTRSNGLLAMVKQMKMYAIAFNSVK